MNSCEANIGHGVLVCLYRHANQDMFLMTTEWHVSPANLYLQHSPAKLTTVAARVRSLSKCRSAGGTKVDIEVLASRTRLVVAHFWLQGCETMHSIDVLNDFALDVCKAYIASENPESKQFITLQ